MNSSGKTLAISAKRRIGKVREEKARSQVVAPGGVAPELEQSPIGGKVRRRTRGKQSPTLDIVVRELIAASGLFDAHWYSTVYGTEIGKVDPLEHYIATGWKRGYSPSLTFDVPFYLKDNPDVAATGVEPLEHYLLHGALEGRPRVPADVGRGGRELIAASGLFDAQWYSTVYGTEIGEADPLEHYITIGWRRGYSPSTRFDVRSYLKLNPDVAATGREPLEHYLLHGALEGRRPVPFDLAVRPVDSDAPPHEQDIIVELGPDDEGVRTLTELHEDPFVRFVSRSVEAQHAIEIGFHGTRSLERLVANLANGAASSRILAETRSAYATARLERVAERLQVSTLVKAYISRFISDQTEDLQQPIWTETAGQHWFIRARLGERDLKNKIGHVDVIIAPSMIFHAYEIIQSLRRLCYLTDGFVLFDTTIVEPFEESVDGEIVSFKDDDIWFAGDMDSCRSRAMARYWAKRGVELEQYKLYPDGLTRQNTIEAGFGGVWWWFFGQAGLVRLLKMSGLEPVDRISLWDGRSTGILARKIPESGISAVRAEPADVRTGYWGPGEV
jgi:hypothetical protein